MIPDFYNKINPNFIEFKSIESKEFIGNNQSNSNKEKKRINYLQKIDNENYIVCNGIETKEIKQKDYNLRALSIDINYYPNYPLDILLYKNESIPFYYLNNKTYIERKSKKLFREFKKYFFEFIESKTFMDVISQKCFINVKEFLKKKKIY